MFGRYLVKRSYLGTVKHLRQSLDIFVFGILRQSSGIFSNIRELSKNARKLLDILNQIIVAFLDHVCFLMEKIYCHSELLTVSIKIKFVIEVPPFRPSIRPYVLAMDNSTYCLEDNTSESQGKSGEPAEASCLNRKGQGLPKNLFPTDLFLGNVA